MQPIHLRSAAAALLLSATACAHAVPAREARSADASEPELIGCTAYVPPIAPWNAHNQVWVDVVVEPTGVVQPGATVRIPSQHERGDSDAIARASQLVQGCTFVPARRDGQPVRASTRMHLAFN